MYGYSIYDVQWFAQNEEKYYKGKHKSEAEDEIDEQTKMFFDLNKG